MFILSIILPFSALLVTQNTKCFIGIIYWTIDYNLEQIFQSGASWSTLVWIRIIVTEVASSKSAFMMFTTKSGL